MTLLQHHVVWYSIPHFVVGAILISLGTLTYLKNQRASINRWFALLCVSISFWYIGFGMCLNTTDLPTYFFWQKLAHTGVLFTLSFYLFLTAVLLQLKWLRVVSVLHSVIAAVIYGLMWTADSYFTGEVYHYSWGLYPKASPLLVFGAVLAGISIFLCYGLFLRACRDARQRGLSDHYQRLKYMCVALMFFGCAPIDYLPKFGVNVYPFGYVFTLIFAVIVTYAILRHRVMDITIAIRRGLLSAIGFGTLVGVYFGVIYAAERMLGMTLLQYHLAALELTAVSMLVLGLFVFWKNPKRHLHQTVALYCFSLVWWSGWECAALQMPTRELAAILFRIDYIGVVFIPTLLCTVVSFLLNFTSHARRKFLAPCFAFSLVALLATTVFPTKYLLEFNKAPMFYLPMCPAAGSFYWIFVAGFLGIVVMGHVLVFRRWRHAVGQERHRLSWFLVGSLVAYLGGCPEFALKYGVRLGWLNPFGLYGIPFYTGMMAYAIVQHQFLDIRVVIRKSLVYSGLVACITATYLVMVLVMEKWFQGFLGYRSLFGTLIAAFLIAVFFNPLRNRIQNWADRALFSATPPELAAQREQLLVEVRKGDQMKAVATLAAGMAHEIKNPLTSLKTFSDYLPSKGSDPVFRQKFQRVVNQEIGKIDRIVHQLLDFSKPVPPQLQLVRMSQLLDDTLDFLNSECLKRRVTIERNYDLDDFISADPRQLRQALLNLLLNSLEAMDGSDGTIIVETAAGDGWFSVIIEDTGPGIPEAHLKQIFEPFFTTKPTGTGLGLSITHGIIQDHGGKIKLENVNGHGARCVLTLPVVTMPRNLVLP